MNSKHLEAFEEFAEKVQEEFGESLKKLVLYGSVARGEETEESDVDVFAVVETEEQKQKLEQMAFEFGVDNNLLFPPNVKTVERFNHRRDHPFIRTVLEEGVEYA